MESTNAAVKKTRERELAAGESIDLDTRVGGGPIIRRDTLVDDAFAVSGTGNLLSRSEIKQLAELAGFDVSESEDNQ